MLKTGKVICPTCSGEVVEFDTIDIEVDDTTVTLFKVGECDHCGNHYWWNENYVFAEYCDLERTYDESEFNLLKGLFISGDELQKILAEKKLKED